MAKRRPKKRTYKMINFKVYFDSDEDILDWWDGIEAGERSEVIRDVIREHIGNPSKRQTKRIELPELNEVRRDTLWIRDTLNDMPTYLERVIEQLLAHAQTMTVGQNPPRASPVVVNDDPALTDEESQRRTNRMRKATW
ncbi:MAG: hypothetical protein RLP44_29925 [Aggregatilineales bacterium]